MLGAALDRGAARASHWLRIILDVTMMRYRWKLRLGRCCAGRSFHSIAACVSFKSKS